MSLLNKAREETYFVFFVFCSDGEQDMIGFSEGMCLLESLQ